MSTHSEDVDHDHDHNQHSTCADHPADAIDVLIHARPRDLGGFSVRRSLPSMRRRLVGPFIFFDHMGPADVNPGEGMDVRPHPHISLATVTYLFEGVVFHRDSLGSAQAIHPGDVNWMIAGSGIAHSERTPPEVRATQHRAHGIQAWVALRHDEEERAPAFIHHAATALPIIKPHAGVEIRLIAGDAFGAHAPVEMSGKMLYAEAKLEANASLELPTHVEERAVYVVTGSLRCANLSGSDDGSDGEAFTEGTMIVFKPGAPVTIQAGMTAAHVMILGGERMDGPRFIWWNFVSSSQERLERAKLDWKEGRFKKVVGDEVEFIPLPEK